MQNIEFKGIVRATSAQNNADGNCEEIINLREKAGSWRAVGKKKKIVSNAPFSQIYLHKYEAFENFIGVQKDKIVWFDKDTFEIKQELGDATDDLEYNQLNNILLIRADNEMLNLTFNNNKYSDKAFIIPDVPSVHFSKGYKTVSSDDFIQFLITDKDIYFPSDVSRSEADAAEQLILAEFNRLRNGEPNYTEGYVFYCTTYELWDGTETRPSAPRVIELGERSESDFYARYQDMLPDDPDYRVMRFKFRDLQLSSLFVTISTPQDKDYSRSIKCVNLYMSNPISHKGNVDVPTLYVYSKRWWKDAIAGHVSGENPYSSKGLPLKYPTSEEIKKMLFYRVAQFDYNDRSQKQITFDAITTNPTMPVDSSSWMKTAGNMFIYNNRLHLYNLRRSFVDIGGFVNYSDLSGADKSSVSCDIYINTGNDEVKVSRNLNISVYDTFFLAVNDSRAYLAKLGPIARKCNMVASETYNFAFALDTQGSGIGEIPENVSDIFQEGSNIIVSAQFNPAYFPAEHSYGMPGKVLNMAVNTEPISVSQIGMYPLYVFTDRGIYALQVGEGKVLYSNVIPISMEVCVQGSHVLQTKFGIVFVTNSALKLINGKEVIDLSEPLKGEIDDKVRSCGRFIEFCKMPYTYDIRPFLSSNVFIEYIKEAVLGYDISENEIIVSNPSYNYTYVYSLESRNWHKITEVFNSINSSIATKAFGGEQNITSAVGSLTVEEVIIKDATYKNRQSQASFSNFNASRQFGLPIKGVMKIGSNVLADVDFPAEIDMTNLVAFMVRASKLNVDVMDSTDSTFIVKMLDKKYVGQTMTLVISGSANVTLNAYVTEINEVIIDEPGSGVGEIITLEIGDKRYEYTVTKDDDIYTVTQALYDKIEFYGKTIDKNKITLTAEPGIEGESIKLWINFPRGVRFTLVSFEGGGDWKEYTSDVYNIENEDTVNTLVYLQTRPVSMDFYGFKKITHFFLRGEFKPVGHKFYTVYVYASNNLDQWAKATEGGFKDSSSHYGIPRTHYSFRYFVITTGGEVKSGHVVTLAEIEDETTLNNRLR